MPAPRAVARFNKRVTNRVLGRVATRLPGFGVVTHRGRRSGRSYRTPVNVFRTPDGYCVALTYGAEADWVRNVLAAGGCELRSRGRQEQLGSPRLVRDDARHLVPGPVRPVLRLLGVNDFLLLSRAGPAEDDRAADGGGTLPSV